MVKIGIAGRGGPLGRATNRGIPQAGRAGKSTNRPPTYMPDGNIPGRDGLPECPTVGTHSNPYNIEDYYVPKNISCIWPGGGVIRPDGEYLISDCEPGEGPPFNAARYPTTPWGGFRR